MWVVIVGEMGCNYRERMGEGTGVEEQAAAHVGAEVAYLPRAYHVKGGGRGEVGGGGGGGCTMTLAA